MNFQEMQLQKLKQNKVFTDHHIRIKDQCEFRQTFQKQVLLLRLLNHIPIHEGMDDFRVAMPVV